MKQKIQKAMVMKSILEFIKIKLPFYFSIVVKEAKRYKVEHKLAEVFNTHFKIKHIMNSEKNYKNIQDFFLFLTFHTFCEINHCQYYIYPYYISSFNMLT